MICEAICRRCSCWGRPSGIARATARAFAGSGWTLQLAGRDIQRLQEVADDCGGASIFPFDALDPASRSALWGFCHPARMRCCALWGCSGIRDCACRGPQGGTQVIECNFTGLIPVLLQAAEAFEARGSGLLIGLSSVAGDRGRASNYAYGSAKAGSRRFFPPAGAALEFRGSRPDGQTGVRCHRNDRRAASSLLYRSLPELVARDILRAVRTGRDVLYTPGWWRPLRAVPRPAGVCGEAFEAVGEEGRAGEKRGGETFCRKVSPPLPNPPPSSSQDCQTPAKPGA